MAKEEKNVEVKEESKPTFWESIKAFFKKPIVQGIAWVLLVIAITALFIAGVTMDEVSKGVTLTFAVLAAVGALGAFITSFIKK